MKKSFLPIMLIVIMLLSSCNTPPADNYVEGIVLAGLKAETSMRAFSDYLSDYETLSIRSTILVFESDSLRDSARVVMDDLQSKSYLDQDYLAFYYDPSIDKVKLFIHMMDASQADLLDFVTLCETQRFERDTSNYNLGDYASLNVPVGKEVRWERTLTNDDFFKWVDLEWYGERYGE